MLQNMDGCNMQSIVDLADFFRYNISKLPCINKERAIFWRHRILRSDHVLMETGSGSMIKALRTRRGVTLLLHPPCNAAASSGGDLYCQYVRCAGRPAEPTLVNECPQSMLPPPGSGRAEAAHTPSAPHSPLRTIQSAYTDHQ